MEPDRPAEPGTLPDMPTGVWQHWKQDAVSGFLVFLIALPLCLGISIASGYPAVAGIFTAVVGSLVCCVLSNSELTIKGPAAGMIVIVLGTVTDFGFTGGENPAADLQAYRLALGVGVAAGVLQVVFALLRFGTLSEFFPTSVVHGMLAAIGVIIFSKQAHTLLGVKPVARDPIGLLVEIPHSIANWNPQITLIGALSLFLLIALPRVQSKWLRAIPAQMLVILFAVPLGLHFDLLHEHTYTFGGHIYGLGPNFLVTVTDNLFQALTFPDFSGVTTYAGVKWTMMFALIGSIESLLSAKAIDLIDPWRRKTNFDRDLLAVGVANTLCATIGGLPMISEIVRSKANIDSGARSRLAGAAHGIFLLLSLACAPWLIHEIPLAALAAMLVYTGFRLASPREFFHMYHIGREQFIIFATTVVGVLATDLLMGIAIGVLVKLVIHLINGVPLHSFFKTQIDVTQLNDGEVTVWVHHSAVFSNWIALKRQLLSLKDEKKVILDLSKARLVDHTVFTKLHELQREFETHGSELVIAGIEGHRSLSSHPLAARKLAKR